MRVRLVAGLLVLLVAAPGVAYANGDPASDVLLQSKIYFPTQRVSLAAAQTLKSIVQSANAKGYPIRVALIRDQNDLGVVPNLLGQPQKYADFLGPEIRFAYKGDLLVVMPTGLGLTTTDETPPPVNAINGMLVDAAGSPDGLAQTAGDAVKRLAAAAGHPLTTAKKSGGSGGTVAGIIVALALLAAGIGGALMLRRNRDTTVAAEETPALAGTPGREDPPALAGTPGREDPPAS